MNRMAVILICIAVGAGAVYGYLSALKNQNPHYPTPGCYDVPEHDLPNAWQWEPSPAWLPSYLLCKVPPSGLGISSSKSGYLFRSSAHRAIYRIGSLLIGGLIAGTACALILAALFKIRKAAPENP